MRIATLVTGVLAMAAGFGLAAVVIGWPVLMVGGPIVFGGAVVVAVTWLSGMQQRHAREYRYAHTDRYGRTDPQHGYVAYDGGYEGAYDDPSTWQDGWSAGNDEVTVDSDDSFAEQWAAHQPGDHQSHSSSAAADNDSSSS
jgi:hypothetical protein